VYTSIASIALGGHFFIPEFAHLTEISRQVDALNSGGCTNHEHLAVPGIVAYMMRALNQLPRDHGELDIHSPTNIS
jgi:hypothetical protein